MAATETVLHSSNNTFCWFYYEYIGRSEILNLDQWYKEGIKKICKKEQNQERRIQNYYLLNMVSKTLP